MAEQLQRSRVIKVKRSRMGITFRDGYYQRFVRIGGRTIKDGEAAAIWNRRGVLQEIIGPKRVNLFYSTIRFMDRHKAEAHEYLEVKHRDGTVENLRGPAHIYLNPGLHDEICVKQVFRLKENEIIQVCQTPMPSAEVPAKNTKYVLHGPATFVPDKNERIEEFKWTELPEELYDRYHLQPKAIVSVLNPFRTRVWNVKVPMDTNVSSGWSSMLAIAMKIESFDKITSCDDPYSSLCAALLADAKALGKRFTEYKFEQIQSEASGIASQNESYPNLFEASEACGIRIESIKLLNFVPGPKIVERLEIEDQRQNDLTKGVAKREGQIQFQELDLIERRKQIEIEIELAKKEAQMQAELSEELHVQKLASIEQEIELAKRKMEGDLESWKNSDEIVLNFLWNLKNIGVDLTQFLCTPAGRGIASHVLDRTPSLLRLQNLCNEKPSLVDVCEDSNVNDDGVQ